MICTPPTGRARAYIPGQVPARPVPPGFYVEREGQIGGRDMVDAVLAVLIGGIFGGLAALATLLLWIGWTHRRQGRWLK